MTKSNPGGRPTKFDLSDQKLIRYMARKGATDQEIADELEIHVQTFYKWKKAHPEFFANLKSWKEEADEKVEQSLYKRATGYDYETEKAFYDKESGMILKDFVKCHSPPDPTSMIFWLKNRKPKEWRDRQELDLGNKGEPIVINLNYKKKGEE